MTLQNNLWLEGGLRILRCRWDRSLRPEETGALPETCILRTNYRPHIEMVREFGVSEDVRPWNIYLDTSNAWKIRVSRGDSVHLMATMMLPYLFKKKDEVKAVIDYLDSRITGSNFVEVLNESVRIGNRVGKIRIVDMPYTREEGQAIWEKKRTGARARSMN